MRIPTCPECGHTLTQFCPCCRGRKGGRTVTPRKLAALRKTGRRRRKRA